MFPLAPAPRPAQGFLSPRFVAVSPIAITNPAIAEVLGEARFSSVTFRLFKLPAGLLETTAEDYGQFAARKRALFLGPTPAMAAEKTPLPYASCGLSLTRRVGGSCWACIVLARAGV